jgi:hypothetical protein
MITLTARIILKKSIFRVGVCQTIGEIGSGIELQVAFRPAAPGDGDPEPLYP